MSEPTAREIALESLGDRQGMVTAHLDRLLNEHSVSPAEANLAGELVHGVTRRRRTLDTVIRAHSDQPKKSLPAPVRDALRIGAYQILFLDRVPDFAAVSESVDLVRKSHRRRAGFVNAVLRTIARSASEAKEGRPAIDRRTVAISADRYRVLDADVFVSPEEAPGEYLAQAVSLPDDLAGRWLAQADSLATAFGEAMQINARPPLVVRVDRTRATVSDALAMMAEAGVEAERHSNGKSLVLAGHVDLAGLEAFGNGLISPQDATATEAVDALDVQPGMRVLDFCAAPGTKTVQIAQALRGKGSVVAVDVNQRKLQRIVEGARRAGLDNVEVRLAETVGSLDPESFDRVLVDAPCSNTGVLARRVEARWRFDAADIGRIAGDQKQILAMATLFLAPSGRLVYSTCSIEPEENDQVVQSFVKRHGKMKLLDRKFTRPRGFVSGSEYHDGGFYAVLAKS